MVLAGLAASVAIRTAAADDWQFYQHDPAHTGDSTAVINPLALSLEWTAPTGYSTPLTVGNAVYATKNGQGTNTPTTISSFALDSGAVNWSYTNTFVFPSQAAVGGGFIVFGAAPTPGGSSSLYVLDAGTGALRYTVPVFDQLTAVMPTVVQDPVTHSVTAYIANGSQVGAVSLGANSGSVLWTQSGSFGGSSLPTVVGSSIVLAGPGQYYAFDRTTGTPNHFQSGNISGGGGTTVAYDSARSQFYVLEDFNGTTPTLSAYHYTSNNLISLVWQRTGAGVGNGGSVAIGPNGDIFSADNSQVIEVDPATGAIVRFVNGSFANGMTPALTNGVLWAFGESQVYAYDLLTLHLLRAFNGSRGSLNSAYDSPGAFTDNHFLLDYGTIFGSHGFDVYAVPEPGAWVLLVSGAVFLLVRRKSTGGG
jgi:hypothetical protein